MIVDFLGEVPVDIECRSVSYPLHDMVGDIRIQPNHPVFCIFFDHIEDALVVCHDEKILFFIVPKRREAFKCDAKSDDDRFSSSCVPVNDQWKHFFNRRNLVVREGDVGVNLGKAKPNQTFRFFRGVLVQEPCTVVGEVFSSIIDEIIDLLILAFKDNAAKLLSYPRGFIAPCVGWLTLGC